MSTQPLQCQRVDLNDAPYEFTVCLLHGIGANALDIMPLAPSLGCAKHWLFPQGPIHIPSLIDAHAWFPSDPSELMKAVSGEYFSSLRTMIPPDLRTSAKLLRSFLESRHIAWDSLIVGGFSQGAIVSAELIRQGMAEGLPLPAAMLLFSGSLVAEAWWDSALEKQRNISVPKVLQVHGLNDEVIPAAEGMALRDTLRRIGISVEWMLHEGGHEINDDCIDTGKSFLDACMQDAISR